jgi:GTP:adenosylcobinamide-phosphate guanylyltransferase
MDECEPPERFTVLVLAGRRGPADPLAAQSGARHKAMLPLAGVPMLVRVLRTVRAARHVGPVLVSIDDPAVLEVPEIAPLGRAGALRRIDCGASPSATVLRCLRDPGTTLPLLVTTADHPLLAPAMVEYFCERAAGQAADVVVGTVRASVLRARHPGVRRTLIRLRDDGFKGANLFAFMTTAGARAAEFWQRAEEFRKRPWRLVSVFGPVSLALFLARRLDLEGALVRASRAIGARIAAVEMPFADCAIDVDGPADVALALRILAERERCGGAS